MRLPRPRLTVRRSMLLMVALALALKLGLAFYRHREFMRRAKACLTLASPERLGEMGTPERPGRPRPGPHTMGAHRAVRSAGRPLPTMGGPLRGCGEASLAGRADP